MKSTKTVIFFVIFFSTVNSYAQKSESLYYYAFDEKIEITPISNKILIKKTSSTTKSVYENLMFNRFKNIKIDRQGDDIFEIEFENENEKNGVIQSSLSDDNISSVSSIYKTNDGLEFGYI